MRILYVAIQYDYGKPEQGFSFEHFNFYDTLIKMGNEIIYFDPVILTRKYGRQEMNRKLVETVKAENPDCLFCVLFGEELDRQVMRDISRKSNVVTLNWFCDDHWRFNTLTKFWAPCFAWSITTDENSLPRYGKIRCKQVILSQWACNHFLYKNHGLPLTHDVSFVGRPHKERIPVFELIRRKGIDIKIWGTGMELGRLDQEDMIKVFNQSRINLNLTASPEPELSLYARTRRILRRWTSNTLDKMPGGNTMKTALRRQRPAQGSSGKRAHVDSPSSTSHARRYLDQIKGRNFEVPGCGGFLLTKKVDFFGKYYEIGKEVGCYDDMNDLMDKIRYYLDHEEERGRVARAGYERTVREHTYVHRFCEIFDRTGLPHESREDIMKEKISTGTTKFIS
jgi:spore maturation protein CgeB